MKLLFLSQPFKNIFTIKPDEKTGYTEDAVIELLIETFSQGIGNRPVALTIKRHPKEGRPSNKPRRSDKLAVDDVSDGNIVSMIEGADLVLGMTSTVLVEACLMGKPVISVQPGLTGVDQCVLSRSGLLELASDQKELMNLAQSGLAQTPDRNRIGQWYEMDRQATQRVINALTEWYQ